MPGQPRECEARLHDRQRRLGAADGAAMLRAEPPFIAWVLNPGVPYNRLDVAHEICRRERPICTVQRMIESRHGHERDVQEPLAKRPCRNARRHDDVGAVCCDCLLRPGQDRVGELHLGVGAELLQLRDDAQQPLPRKCGVHHDSQLRLPASFEIARQRLEALHVPDYGTRAFQQNTAVRRQHSLAPLDGQQRDVHGFLQARNGVAHRRLAAMQSCCRLRETSLVDHCGQHAPLLQRGPIQRHDPFDK